MTYGTVNADVITTSTAGGILGAGNASIMKNRIINGAMVIDQRNAGASVTTADAYTLDRWKFTEDTDGAASVQQISDAPAGFNNSARVTVTTADASIGSSQFTLFWQPVEGFNWADLSFGTANAKSTTLSFWVKSSLTGTFSGSLENADGGRSYIFTYTINSANTWEQKSITIAGDTTGTWLTTTGIGVKVFFTLTAGSSFQGAAGSWGTSRFGATGTTQLMSTVNATWQITGVQLEVGSQATGYEYRQYGQELALCQRYYEKSFNTSVAPAQNVGANLYEIPCTAVLAGTGQARFPVKFLVTKRTSPTTTTTYNPSAANAQARDLNAVADCSSTSIIYASDNFMLIQATQPSGTSAGNRIAVNWSAEAEL